MPVKIDPQIMEELAAMDLVLWEAKHPRVPFFNEKTQKQSSREDKAWVTVTLMGPGVTNPIPWGAPTLRAAVDKALAWGFMDRVTGLKGAMMWLEKELGTLEGKLRWERMKADMGFEGEDDDFIPF